MEKQNDNNGFVPYNKWLHQHDEAIKADYGDKPTEELAEKYDVNYYTVSRRATRLGVSKSDKFMRTSWGKGARKGVSRRSEEWKQFRGNADEYMKAHFHNTANADLAKMLGVDIKTIRRWARRLGLQKTEEFMFYSRSKTKNNRPYYTPEQIAWRNKLISEIYPDGSEDQLQQLADKLGVKLSVLKVMARAIGVYRSPERVSEANRIRGEKSRKYSRETIAELAAYYLTHSNKDCSEKFGISEGVINQIATHSGWKKDAEYLHRLRSDIMRKRHRDKRQK